MAFWRKAMQYLGLVDEDEYEDDGYGDEYDDEYHYDREESAAPAAAPVPAGVGSGGRGAQTAESGPVRVLRPPGRTEAGSSVTVTAVPMTGPRVHVMEPRNFNDAQGVGDQLKAGQPVILNLQGLERELQRRLIDFSSGLAYALGGAMAKAADQVFLLTPSNVEVSEEEKERLQARGLYRPAR